MRGFSSLGHLSLVNHRSDEVSQLLKSHDGNPSVPIPSVNPAPKLEVVSFAEYLARVDRFGGYSSVG